MTPRQRELLRFIERHLHEHDGIAPSFAEMGEALGGTGRGSLHRMIGELIEQGHLISRPGRARSLSLPPKTDWSRISDHEVRDEYARRFGGLAA